MYVRKTQHVVRCSHDYAGILFSGKWKSHIMCMLSCKGTLRYNIIKANLPEVTDTVLTKALKELVDGKLISRKQYNEMPIRVEYSLTKKGESLLPVIKSVCQWCQADYEEEYGANSYPSYCPLHGVGIDMTKE